MTDGIMLAATALSVCFLLKKFFEIFKICKKFHIDLMFRVYYTVKQKKPTKKIGKTFEHPKNFMQT